MATEHQLIIIALLQNLIVFPPSSFMCAAASARFQNAATTRLKMNARVHAKALLRKTHQPGSICRFTASARRLCHAHSCYIRMRGESGGGEGSVGVPSSAACRHLPRTQTRTKHRFPSRIERGHVFFYRITSRLFFFPPTSHRLQLLRVGVLAEAQ